MGGIWREGICDVMWSFRRARAMGGYCQKTSEESNGGLFATLLARSNGSMFNLDRWGIAYNANFDQFGVSKNSFIKACSMVDYDLELHPVINSFYIGIAVVTIIRQEDLIMLANVGDSRAVLGTTSDDGEEREIHNRRSVCELDDEPGVSRIRASIDKTLEGPGLALSRAFRDFFLLKCC
ncbi:putative PPM-type phosphatase domain, protein phosphatase 2C family [Helianthus anomalus]